MPLRFRTTVPGYGGIACAFNVGPGGVGPLSTYEALPEQAKRTLSRCMIAGRLEFYTLLVNLPRLFWQR